MEKRKGARWLWAAWAVTAGGCALAAGLEDGYYVQKEGSGGSGTGGEAGAGGAGSGMEGAGGAGGGMEGAGGAGGGMEGAGGAGGGDECTSAGKRCVHQTCVDGKCTGECGPEDVRCSEENRPQRCGERGSWEDADPCGAATPACDAGKCVPRSCIGLAETCGPDSNESCCATGEAVPGGTFNRGNDAAYPATVSGFLLDRFEVTVGRFRKFVEAYPGSKPAAGAGAHPRIEGSGWNADWASKLPVDAAALKAAVKCEPEYQTWTDAAGVHEHLPMSCLSWYVAFAFCAWDGGRLATEAEWNYAAAGGGGADGQRVYPWSKPADSTAIDADHAVYGCGPDASCAPGDIQAVGSRSPGDGRWGQADLAGNLREWVLDWHAAPYPSGDCKDCANITMTSARVLRGGGWNDVASTLLSSGRNYDDPSARTIDVGARCARTPR
ncbi:formylglycine-generating enzyme family protein [Sorangium sp. So ce1000]|uniref:formylglycine-generating enzyme family protein n=1 Tax=Sorangium sp. So ce1000 TaxID=3133325 RepID=UPI003F63EF76